MGWWALASSAAAAAALAASGPGLYVAMGFAIAAIACGLVGFRGPARAPRQRLAGASAVGLGSILLLLSFVEYGLVIAAIEELTRMAG